jgi:hypothetical protein
MAVYFKKKEKKGKIWWKQDDVAVALGELRPLWRRKKEF